MMRHSQSHRRGVAALLAMLYLILFAALALGFYAATAISNQVVYNDTKTSTAMLAAESGMEFLRYQLATVKIPAFTKPEQIANALHQQLRAQLVNTRNMGFNDVGLSGNVISIPAASTQYITLYDDSRFRATIQINSDNTITVKSLGLGSSTSVQRAVQMNYTWKQRDGLFDYAVASKGKIATSGSSHVYGSPDRATANMLAAANGAGAFEISGKEIGGDVSISGLGATVNYQGGTVGGESEAEKIQAEHIHVVPPPEFPTIDTEMFKKYATNSFPPETARGNGNRNALAKAAPYRGTVSALLLALSGRSGLLVPLAAEQSTSGGTVYRNTYIRAGQNPSFNAGDVIEGVLYIEPGNTVTFNGHCTIRGIIVVGKDPNKSIEDTVLKFNGTTDVYGVDTLDANDPELAPIRQYTGSFVLAEQATLNFSGNFGTTVSGSIVGGAVSFQGSCGGSIRGSVIGMNSNYPLTLNNSASSDIVFMGRARNNPPAGLGFSSYFTPLTHTYDEAQP